MSADTEQVQLAAQTFIYGYPLVYNLRETEGFTSGASSLPISAAFNEFACARSLAARRGPGRLLPAAADHAGRIAGAARSIR
jgi:hypothetical protein